MAFVWLVAGAALVAAAGAWMAARRVSARLAQLSDMYWELKYQHLELRKQVERVAGVEPPPATSAEPPPQAKESFVPLASLRR